MTLEEVLRILRKNGVEPDARTIERLQQLRERERQRDRYQNLDDLLKEARKNVESQYFENPFAAGDSSKEGFYYGYKSPLHDDPLSGNRWHGSRAEPTAKQTQQWSKMDNDKLQALALQFWPGRIRYLFDAPELALADLRIVQREGGRVAPGQGFIRETQYWLVYCDANVNPSVRDVGRIPDRIVGLMELRKKGATHWSKPTVRLECLIRCLAESECITYENV